LAGFAFHLPTFRLLPALSLATGVVLLLSGCQNGPWGNPPRIPPPSGAMQAAGSYYTPPAGGWRPGSTSLSAAAIPTQGQVSLAPNANVPPVNRSADNTYDVASRVAADNQAIRVVEGNSRSTTVAVAPRGMPVNDGTLQVDRPQPSARIPLLACAAPAASVPHLRKASQGRTASGARAPRTRAPNEGKLEEDPSPGVFFLSNHERT
jgi:hypothetical protein